MAEMLFPLANADSRQKLEAWRIEYEQSHGPTDLTVRYTSTWLPAYQEWLIQHETRRYFDGLPPFAKAWIKGKFVGAAREGTLDDMPDEFLRLYLANEMRLDPPQRGYRGW
jgi:hypothetical protein